MYKPEAALEGKKGWHRIRMTYYPSFTLQEKFKIHSLLVIGTDFFKFYQIKRSRNYTKLTLNCMQYSKWLSHIITTKTSF